MACSAEMAVSSPTVWRRRPFAGSRMIRARPSLGSAISTRYPRASRSRTTSLTDCFVMPSRSATSLSGWRANRGIVGLRSRSVVVRHALQTGSGPDSTVRPAEHQVNGRATFTVSWSPESPSSMAGPCSQVAFGDPSALGVRRRSGPVRRRQLEPRSRSSLQHRGGRRPRRPHRSRDREAGVRCRCNCGSSQELTKVLRRTQRSPGACRSGFPPSPRRPVGCVGTPPTPRCLAKSRHQRGPARRCLRAHGRAPGADARCPRTRDPSSGRSPRPR